MTLQELQNPFSTLAQFNTQYDNVSSEDLIENIDENREAIVSILICRTWNSLVNIFYKSNLSAEECYDIYLEALEYILKTKPWTNKSNSLYKDKNAFSKAMMKCVSSRKNNYITAQHRQKRKSHTEAISLDYLNETYQEGYFTNNSYSINIDDTFDELLNEIANDTTLFGIPDYFTVLVLDNILYSNVFDSDGEFSQKKLVSCLKALDDLDCRYISEKYNLDYTQLFYVINNFKCLQSDKLYYNINTSLNKIRKHTKLKLVN